MAARKYVPDAITYFAIELAYDGTDFVGYAKQRGQTTVQGVLESSLSVIFGPTLFSTAVAGRTDRGVHALTQVVSVSLERELLIDLDKLVRSLEKLTPNSVSIRRAVAVDEHFHARFSAVRRRYWYLLSTASFELPHLRRLSWNIGASFDFEVFFQTASQFVGEHDFTSFCRKDVNSRSLVRRVESVAVYEWSHGLYAFEIVANAFCHQMVRSIVGFLVQVGRGFRGGIDLADLLVARSRASTVDLAPPYGLYLAGIGYREPYESIMLEPIVCPGIKLFASVS